MEFTGLILGRSFPRAAFDVPGQKTLNRQVASRRALNLVQASEDTSCVIHVGIRQLTASKEDDASEKQNHGKKEGAKHAFTLPHVTRGVNPV